MTLFIRQSRLSDQISIFALLSELDSDKVKNRPSNFILTDSQSSMIQQTLGDKRSEVWVYEKADEIIGVVTFFKMPNLRTGRWQGWIHDLVVSKPWRSKGIGTRLLQHLTQRAQQEGLEEIKIPSGLQRKRAHRFYQTRGATHTEKLFTIRL